MPVFMLQTHNNHPYHVYDYTTNRSRAGPEEFLRDYKEGFLQADAYAGYNFIFDDPLRNIIELLCWAHARRKFYDARKTAPELSHTAIAWIKLLYDVEREIKDLSTPEKKRARQEKSVVILNDFKNWLFFGSDNGGRTAAVIFTITQSAKRHNLNVFTYLKDIIARISDHPANQLHDLLPDNWTPNQ